MAFNPVSIALKPFPEHAALIGDMLLGYGELEFFTLELLARSFGGMADIPKSTRILYRLRGANDRLNVADAILRPFMSDIKLSGQFSQWLGAMRRCRVIRNQYAHCAWGPQRDRLWLANLDEAAQSSEGSIPLEFYPIDLPILKEQQAFFRYALDLTIYLMGEVRYRTDRRRTRERRPLPKSRAAPNLHSLQDGQKPLTLW